MNEILIFSAFGVLQVVFHNAHKAENNPWVYKATHSHWLVWLFHPTVVHTVQDYGIHFVIYSGKIISGH